MDVSCHFPHTLPSTQVKSHQTQIEYKTKKAPFCRHNVSSNISGSLASDVIAIHCFNIGKINNLKHLRTLIEPFDSILSLYQKELEQGEPHNFHKLLLF